MTPGYSISIYITVERPHVGSNKLPIEVSGSCGFQGLMCKAFDSG